MFSAIGNYIGQMDPCYSVCFVEGTLVSTEDGLKAIGIIQVGNYVWSQNIQTGEIALKQVVNVFINETDVLVNIYVDDTIIRATETHPFWVEEKGWVSAKELTSGDRLRLQSGEIIQLDKIEINILEEPIKVYNFEVEDWHTYFVSSESILVHNKCKPDQLHHFATNKNKKYTPELKKITDKYGLDLDGDWNKAMMPHQGRHPYAYHEYVLEEMRAFDAMAQGDVGVFKALYEGLKQEIKNNPEMLYKAYWLK